MVKAKNHELKLYINLQKCENLIYCYVPGIDFTLSARDLDL